MEWHLYQRSHEACHVLGDNDATHFGTVYEGGLLPFIQERFPDRHRLYQDNDPKHSSKYIERFLEEKGVNWWYTPTESPAVELVWGSLKQYLKTTLSQKAKDRN